MSISSLSFNAATRATIMRLQTELKDANTELGSSRHADVGLTLGRLSGEAVQYHSQETSIQKMLDSNKLVTSRLEMMDDTLDGVKSSAESLSAGLTTLMSDLGNAVAIQAVKDTASAAMASMVGALNINVTGQYLFAGAQTDFTPMKNLTDDVGADFRKFLEALSADAGEVITAQNIPIDDLKQYLSGTVFANGESFSFDALFDPAKTEYLGWSEASDTPVVSRISKNETIESSLSAKDPAFRKLAAAYSLLNSVGLETMSSEARKEVASAALTRVSEGMSGTTSLRAELGTRINRVELANTGLTNQKDLVTAAIDRLEGVDVTEASLRISALETQLQASFTVTGRLKNLSLMDYL